MKVFRFILMLIGAIVAGLAATAFTASLNSLILFLSLMMLFFSSLTLWLRYRVYGGNDPFLLFVAFFILYNGLFLLQVVWSMYRGIPVSSSFPVSFDPDTYLKAALASCLASISLFAATVLAMLIPVHTKKQSTAETWPMPTLRAGIVAFFIGLVLLFLDFQRIGGFFYALSLPRGVRLNLLSEVRGSLPYAPFIFAGLALVWLDYAQHRTGKFWAFGLLGFLILLMLVQGDRRFLTYAILIAFAAYTGIRYPRFRISPRLIMGLVILFIAYSFFGQIRWLLQPVLFGQISLQEAIEWVEQNASATWFAPSVGEFAGPYFTLLYSIEYSYPPEAPLKGMSYLQAIPNLLPRSLYPGNKPAVICDAFADFIYQKYMPGRESIIGWGYSPVAEAYNNFGLWGIFIPFFLLGLLWEWVARLRYRSRTGIIVYVLLMPQVLNLNRIAIAWSFQECVYFIGAGLLVLTIRAILPRGKARGLGKA